LLRCHPAPPAQRVFFPAPPRLTNALGFVRAGAFAGAAMVSDPLSPSNSPKRPLEKSGGANGAGKGVDAKDAHESDRKRRKGEVRSAYRRHLVLRRRGRSHFAVHTRARRLFFAFSLATLGTPSHCTSAPRPRSAPRARP
jgi:hypothetical protein